METIEKIENSEVINNINKDDILGDGEKVFLFWKGKRYQGVLGHEVLRIYLMKEEVTKTSNPRTKKDSFITNTLFKKYIDIFSTFRQYGEDRKKMSNEEIFNCPKWVRVIHNFSKDFSPQTSNSDLFIGKGIEISSELLEKINETVEQYFEDALGLRNTLCNLLIDNGITIDIDPIVEK